MPIQRTPVKLPKEPVKQPAPIIEKSAKQDPEEELVELEDSIKFFSEKLDADGNFKDININYVKLINFYKSLGFARYDIERGRSILILIENRVISEVTTNEITDKVISFLYKLDYNNYERLNSELLVNKFYKALGSYFSTDKLNRMVLDHYIDINQDSKAEAFFYYSNGYVRCTKDGWDLKEYSKLQNYLWKDQILSRNFKHIDVQKEEHYKKCGVFADFIGKVSNEDEERFKSLCSIIGYNLHTYTENKLKATILTDSRISDVADGRTGKTLFCKSLGHMRNYCEINGKDFDPVRDQFKYQEVNFDTQIVHLNDVRKYFNMELLFNDITEGIKVNKKGLQPFTVKLKMIISTNQTIQIEGASARDRSIEFEFSDYFSDKRSPQDEYKHWFFTDWDAEEWAKYDNFMMYCTSVYLRIGLYQTRSINLEARKLRDQTNPEFIEFMTDLKVIPDEQYDKKKLFQDFKSRFNDYDDGKLKQRRFTEWLRKYADLSPHFKKINKEQDETRSNSNDYIIFRSNKPAQS
ncbi:primase-helicase family protein [Pontibacter toksunensis]|uniref:Primase-helicase family protein n=1 Tax=Pontibacter toksunensis TaxID=1332631 RepID=A0ABW6BWT5_9BACT